MNIVKGRNGRRVKVVSMSEHSNYISSNDKEMDARAVEAVRAAVNKAIFCNKPVAKYDKQMKKVYIEYANGDRKDFDY